MLLKWFYQEKINFNALYQQHSYLSGCLFFCLRNVNSFITGFSFDSNIIVHFQLVKQLLLTSNFGSTSNQAAVQNICTEMGLTDAARQYVSRAQAKEEIENHNHRTVKKK